MYLRISWAFSQSKNIVKAHLSSVILSGNHTISYVIVLMWEEVGLAVVVSWSSEDFHFRMWSMTSCCINLAFVTFLWSKDKLKNIVFIHSQYCGTLLVNCIVLDTSWSVMLWVQCIWSPKCSPVIYIERQTPVPLSTCISNRYFKYLPNCG